MVLIALGHPEILDFITFSINQAPPTSTTPLRCA